MQLTNHIFGGQMKFLLVSKLQLDYENFICTKVSKKNFLQFLKLFAIYNCLINIKQMLIHQGESCNGQKKARRKFY